METCILNGQKLYFRIAKHTLEENDVILICDEDKEIHFIMFYKSHHEDTSNESKGFFSKKSSNSKIWKYIIECSDVKKLCEPLGIRDLPNPDNKAYENIQTFVYIDNPDDVTFVTKHLLRNI